MAMVQENTRSLKVLAIIPARGGSKLVLEPSYKQRCDMCPSLSSQNHQHGGLRYPQLPGQYSRGCRASQNHNHLIIRQFGIWNVLASLLTVQLHIPCMSHVFFSSHILQVVNDIVQMVAIPMVYFISYGAWAKKSMCNESVNQTGKGFSNPSLHLYRQTGAIVHDRFFDMDKTHSPKIRNFIMTTRFCNRHPDFLHNNLRIGTSYYKYTLSMGAVQ